MSDSTGFVSSSESIQDALQKHFGFDKFKGHQEAIIKSVLDGKDTFVIMPTGGGKSLCYQLPALMMPGTALIISPLIALMKNQVDSIRSYSEEDNVAHFLNSSLNRTQMKQVKGDITDGKTKLLYVAPETLTKEENLDFFALNEISFIAVDEAHCISEWGHDFRPEYRRIRTMIESISKTIPIIALTATATPKVRTDIIKTLKMEEPNEFVSSFNRDNLYYEIRPKGKKDDAVKSIIQFVKGHTGKSGIIYVQSRKAAEDIAKILVVNGIKAAPYHAGLDAKVRTETQDGFLMEDFDVIVATIAFGMGIDKPDVRFVIHYDFPKSIENYYQETGRAGRDGLEGICLAYYNYTDIVKLEKFLRDKPASERDMGMQLLSEVMGYAETTDCRRKYLLHYFGETYDSKKCNDKCDNCKHPKERVEASEEMTLALKVVEGLNENFHMKMVVDFILGRETKMILDYKLNDHDLFGEGDEKNELFWNSIIRAGLLDDLLYKDIELYGVLKLTEAGKKFIKEPRPFKLTLNHDFDEVPDEPEGGGGAAVLDETLFSILKDLNKRIAKRNNVPAFVVFQEPSLMDMSTQYPLTNDDLLQCSGVSAGKINRYGKEFLEAINKYVEENDIERPTDFVVKSIANKSKTKVTIIQSIDKKIPLYEIAETNGLKWDELMDELYAIVTSGTKVNIKYTIEKEIDEYVQEIVYDYFTDADSDDVDRAFKEVLKEDEDIKFEEVQMMRIKFLSDNN